MNIIKNLFEAARKNNVQSIKEIINEEGIKEYINMILVEASELGNLEVVRYLVEEAPDHMKADINFEENRAFLWAINKKRWHVVKYYIDKGIPKELNNNYLYTNMLQDKNCHTDSLFIELQNNIKETIRKATNHDLQKYENHAIKINDDESKELIEEIKLKNLETIKDREVILDMLKMAIKNKSFNIIKYALETIKIDDEIANLIAQLDDKEIIDFLLLKIDLNNKNETIKLALKLEKNYYYSQFKTNIYYAFKILEKYKNYFIQNNNYANFDNYSDFKEREFFFNPISCLKRHYTSIKYDNNYQALTAQLLNQALNVLNVSSHTNEILNYIIENRKLLFIKDEHIVQYFIEGNYDFHEIEVKKKFYQIINLLIQHNIDFSSDTSGFLIQIAAMNKYDDIIFPIVEQGSNLNEFLNRYNDKKQWLNEKEQENLYETDYNNDRQYDIYKKFDEDNCFPTSFLEQMNVILNYRQLNQKISKNNNNEIKSKI